MSPSNEFSPKRNATRPPPAARNFPQIFISILIDGGFNELNDVLEKYDLMRLTCFYQGKGENIFVFVSLFINLELI